jgi:D-alanyl-D-alanine carboxypeptidase
MGWKKTTLYAVVGIIILLTVIAVLRPPGITQAIAPPAGEDKPAGADKPVGGEDEPGGEEPAGEEERETPAKPGDGNGGTTRPDGDGRQVVTNPDSILVLVNKERNLPADYVPADLTVPAVPFPFDGDNPKKQLRREAAAALEELFAASREAGLELYALSGYRSYATQKAIFENKAKLRGEAEANKTSARPGQSEHQTGLAMDVTCRQVNFALEEEFGATPEGKWLAANAHKFGFIIRYRQGTEEITGYVYEPWHLRYLGKETAADVYAQGVTLEEYFGGEDEIK